MSIFGDESAENESVISVISFCGHCWGDNWIPNQSYPK